VNKTVIRACRVDPYPKKKVCPQLPNDSTQHGSVYHEIIRLFLKTHRSILYINPLEIVPKALFHLTMQIFDTVILEFDICIIN